MIRMVSASLPRGLTYSLLARTAGPNSRKDRVVTEHQPLDGVSQVKRSDSNYGQWRCQEKLGEGGNGQVWRAVNSCGESAALKVLAHLSNKSNSKARRRFEDEIRALQGLSDVEGILPVIEYSLPGDADNQAPWYVMPLAKPISEYLESKGYEEAVSAILEIGRTLAKLHERRICHRDIKPANILVRDGKFFLADFGLVDFPDKRDVTTKRERIGARWTIAPEMERNSQVADAMPADVYSLAKTLWILLTRRMDGFEGQYDPQSVNALSNFDLFESDRGDFHPNPPSLYTRPLDDLLKLSTDNDPSRRPIVSDFVERLGQWLLVLKDFQQRVSSQWYDVQVTLFPRILPTRATWESIDAIVDVLKILSNYDNLNHMLFPGSGGLDLLGVEYGLEPDSIELVVGDKSICLVKPIRLMFESFELDWEWNYFRLEVGGLEPTGLTKVHRKLEYLYEVGRNLYVSEREWYRDQENDQTYPRESRSVSRCMGGSFLFVKKTSLYNQIGATYDGRHDQLSADEFRDYIRENGYEAKELLNDQQLKRLASEKGYTIEHLVRAHFEAKFRQEYIDRFGSRYADAPE